MKNTYFLGGIGSFQFARNNGDHSTLCLQMTGGFTRNISRTRFESLRAAGKFGKVRE
jgi:hypothetical protein